MSAQRKGNKIAAIMNKYDAEIAGLVDFAYACELDKEHDNAYLGFNYIVAAQMLALYKSLSYNISEYSLYTFSIALLDGTISFPPTFNKSIFCAIQK